MKKILVLFLTLSLVSISFVGCKSSDKTKDTEIADTAETADTQENTVVEKETYELKIGTVLIETDPICVGLEQLAQKVSERTNGEVKIDIYPSSLLGDTNELVEKAKEGENVGVLVDTGVLAEYVPDMGIYTAPYLFDNVKEARQFVESDMFKAWDEELVTNGLRDLSCNWYQGARHFLTNKEINTPADLKGLSVRTMGSEIAQETMKSFGTKPVSLAWAEVYAGLSDKSIDSAEAQLTAVYGASLQETVTYIAKTGHFLLFTSVVISEDWFKKLPEEYQTIILEESLVSGDYATKLTQEKEVEYQTEMEKVGVKFIDVDIAPFKEASASVYETMDWTQLKKDIDKSLGKK